jgi:hypothetical protein
MGKQPKILPNAEKTEIFHHINTPESLWGAGSAWNYFRVKGLSFMRKECCQL